MKISKTINRVQSQFRTNHVWKLGPKLCHFRQLGPF